MTRIEHGSDRAHPLPGRREGEAGGATITRPCGTADRSGDADRPSMPKPAVRVRIHRIYDPDEVRPCVVSGAESSDRADDSAEGGAG
jgi:hypothetical protein